MIRRPPRSTLFPYTDALPISAEPLLHALEERLCQRSALALRRGLEGEQRLRSEEHTSELQSLAYLVCRLLLEKKKRTQPVAYPAIDDTATSSLPTDPATAVCV